MKASRSESIDPAKTRLIWRGEAASQSQVDAAVKAARTAFYHWSDLALEERLAIVRRYADLLGEHKEALALTIARETGKPGETRTEVAAMQARLPSPSAPMTSVPARWKTPCRAPRRSCATSPMASWPCSAPTTSRATCPTATLCRRSSPAMRSCSSLPS